ncbi:hypothetical protein LG296_12835 [Ureibacillus chungkukjangi]|uniref:hypothetical protein n=1 Tax=Ureibacillus chungkukjangi TaxID=1202712 RepID=UPI00384ACBCE
MIIQIRFIGIMCIVCVLFLVGCKADDTDEDSWKESPTFYIDDKKMYGVKGEIGLERLNGEENEPDFPATQGRLYNIHFFDASKEFYGEQAVITATHQNTGKTIELYNLITSSIASAKFGFEDEGLWKISVSINEEPYTSFIIRAEKP